MKTQSNLYTLSALPNTPAEYLVMVATIDTIAAYLGCSPAFRVLMHQEATGKGESVFEMDGTPTGRTGRVGIWRVQPGAHLPAPRPVASDENIGSVVT